MFGSDKDKKYRSVQDIQKEVRKKLAVQRGEVPEDEVPTEMQRQRILEDLRQSERIQKNQEARELKEQKDRDKTTSPKPVNKIYGDFVPPDTFQAPKKQKIEPKLRTSPMLRYRILEPGSPKIDYILRFPYVLRRLFVDLRDPIPFWDKLLFIGVFIVVYALTVTSIVLHYKYIKEEKKFILEGNGKKIEIIVKEEDIPELRKTLGPDWLKKLSEGQLKD